MKKLAKLHQEQMRIYRAYQDGSLSHGEYIVAITPLDQMVTQLELSMLMATIPAWQRVS